MYLCTYLTFLVILGILQFNRGPVQNGDLLNIVVSMAKLKGMKALNSRCKCYIACDGRSRHAR